MIWRKVFTSILESLCFRTPFQSQSVHGTQTLLKPALQHFYLIFSLIYDKLSWKASLLVRFEILGLLGNTLTADYMYSRHRWEKSHQQVIIPPTLLSQNKKYLLKILLHFYNLRKIFPILKKKDHLHTPSILTPRNVVTSIPEYPCFRTPFQSQSVHGTQTLLKAAMQHFYLNFPLI